MTRDILAEGLGHRPAECRLAASVLIADDDPNIVLALQFLMEKEGYRVRVATDGAAALADAVSHRPDVILLDAMMPRRNGFEVCAAIRANPDMAETRIVMLTAKGLARERKLGLQAGADEYVTKPFSNHDVLQLVRRLTPQDAVRPGAGGV
jgi:DNA-binding response OmpR family regulator